MTSPGDSWRLDHVFPGSLGDLRWDRFGDPDDEPVVLLHGTPFSSFIWRHVGRALARHHHVHVWDMPGYGQSDKHEGQDLSLAALDVVFAELLAYWNLEAPTVVAHDSGGAVALGAHLRHGLRYRRLVLVDAVALEPWGSTFFRSLGDHPTVLAQVAPKLHNVLIREYIRSASYPGLHPSVLDALAAPWLDPLGQAAFYRQLAQRRDDQDYTDSLKGRYPGIDIPVLLCWGQNDAWVPVERGHELAARIPNARIETFSGAGHLLQEDSPAELTAAVLDFIHD